MLKRWCSLTVFAAPFAAFFAVAIFSVALAIGATVAVYAYAVFVATLAILVTVIIATASHTDHGEGKQDSSKCLHIFLLGLTERPCCIY
jgi:hypothetical protein